MHSHVGAEQESQSSTRSEREVIVQLARHASVEMTVHDASQLRAASKLLRLGRRIYVSHLPGQAWSDTIAACKAVHALGATAIPHVPVRCVRDRQSLQRFLDECVALADVHEVLLIAGDYGHSVGPFSTTMDVLQTGLLLQHGIDRVSVAGHPEGHPFVSPDELRRAEREKIEYALSCGLPLTFLTQFFFAAEPFVDWHRRLPIPTGTTDRISVVAGLAGPAKLTTLLRYAAICGVGPSARALGARPAMLGKMLTERGPETIVHSLATHAQLVQSGIHLFSFGGLARTLAWLDAIEQGRFQMHGELGFVVRDRD